MILSAINIESLSAAAEPITFSFINQNKKNIIPSQPNSAINLSLSSYNFLKNVKDIEITKNSISFLTDSIYLSCLMHDGYNNSKQTINKYFLRGINDLTEDYTLDVSSSKTIKNNYLVTSPLSSDLLFNIIPLKSEMGVNEECGWFTNFRDYASLQFNNLPGSNDENIIIEYKSSYKPFKMKSDEVSSILISGTALSVPVSSIGLIESGAIAGSRPLNSDVIYIDSSSYNNTVNGRPLCLWLSGSSVLQNFPAQWMERWFDADNISEGDAFIAPVNTSMFSNIIDIPSTVEIKTGDEVSYNRYGPNRNSEFINYISDTRSLYLSSWGQIFSDDTNDVSGFVEGVYNYTDSDLILDGNIHAQIPPNDKLLKDYNFTTSFWFYKDDWRYGPDSQIFGNFSNFEGYGITYSTGGTTSLITFPSNAGLIYGFNSTGYKIFEKNLNNSLQLTNSLISNIVTDFFGARWLYDSNNKVIIKLESDDLLTCIINLPTNANITTMKMSGLNQLHVMNSATNTISAFDTNGNLVYDYFISPKYNCFDIDSNNKIKTSVADAMIIDNNDNVYKVLGGNIYKNDQVYFHVGKKINCLRFDLDNSLWILYNNNRILKITDNQKIVFDFVLPVYFQETSFEMSFVKEIIHGDEQDILWIVFNTNQYILKINSKGDVIKRLDLNSIVNLTKCNPFQLTTNGDFTDYDIKRKFTKDVNGNHISSKNPAFGVKMNLTCGQYIEFFQKYYPVNELRGWVHFALTHEINDNTTAIKFYINGIERMNQYYGYDQTISNIKKVNFGTKVSPFIIGGVSGKLGANNLERSIEGQYLIGRFNELNIHQKVLNAFEILSLANHRYYTDWRDLIFYVPSNSYTCLEHIDHFHLNRPPGHKSNKFNIVIKGITDSSVQSNITSYILSKIENIKPAHTILNDIIFK